jgi:hypothetical protein
MGMNSSKNGEVKDTTMRWPSLFSFLLTIIFNERETKRRINGPTTGYGLCLNDWMS